MEMRFDRDVRHNYMVLCGITCGEDYRLRMVSENHPAGLLRCSLRNINGESYLYYEIDSKQPMRNRYADKGLHIGEVRRLLRGILQLADTLEDYLLDMDHILFSADCVYADMRTEEFLFVYCPSSEEDVTSVSGFCAFSEALLSYVDPEDEKAARVVYTLCALASEHGMRVTDMVRAALEEDDEQDTDPAGEDRSGVMDNMGTAPTGELPTDRGGCIRNTGSPVPYSMPSGNGEDKPFDGWGEDDEEKREKKGIAGLVWAVLFILVLIGNLVIRQRFYLNARENYLSLATAGVSIAMTALSLILWFRGRGEKKKEDTEREPSESGNGWMSAGIEEAEQVGIPGSERRQQISFRQQSADDEEASEETTVLTDLEDERCSRLYGRGGEKTINISLAQLPLTVGKLSGCADYVIRDPSVSRMHTRFFGDGTGKATQMKDLNSTNGTFLNGRRLAPNETVSIRSGDEIGIGRFVFELR
jgi:hypothetical protein